MERRKGKRFWSEHQIVLGITAVATILRLYKLGYHSFWFDEAREVLRIQTPWPDILLISDGADPPIFRLLHHPISLFTTDEFWLRLPALLFSVTAVYLTYVWLNQLGRPKLGVAAAALMALAPVEILYAQEVSQYSMTVALTLLLLITFEQAAQNGRFWDWLLLTLVCVISIYSYYGLAWLLPILDLDLAWRSWKQRSRRRLVGFLSFHILLGLSIVFLYTFYLAEQFARVTRNNKVAAVFLDPGLKPALRNLDNQLFLNFARFFTTPFSPQAPEFITWFFIGLFILGIVGLWQTKHYRIIGLLIAFLITLYIAFGFGFYPFGHRYALLLTPLFFAFIASALIWLWQWKPVGIGTTLLVTLFFVAFLPNLPLVSNPLTEFPSEEIRPVITYLNENLQQDDAIYIYYGAVPAYQVYQPDEVGPTTYGTWFFSLPVTEKLAEVNTAVADAPRFWLIMSHLKVAERDELIAGLTESKYELSDQYLQPNAEAYLFTTR